MKVLVYMTVTPNGMVAKGTHSQGFGSEFDWKLFVKKVEEVGNVIVGRHTFETAAKGGSFPIKALNIVMTSKKIKNKWGEDVIFTNKKPKEVLNFLKKVGFKTALVGGGETLVSQFMKEKLIDELLLDVSPEIFTKGIHLFESGNFEKKLKLLNVKRISTQEVQLHYKVIK